MRIRFGCGLDSRIYGIYEWKRSWPVATFHNDDVIRAF
jgi:hypothetical protein